MAPTSTAASVNQPAPRTSLLWVDAGGRCGASGGRVPITWRLRPGGGELGPQGDIRMQTRPDEKVVAAGWRHGDYRTRQVEPVEGRANVALVDPVQDQSSGVALHRPQVRAAQAACQLPQASSRCRRDLDQTGGIVAGPPPVWSPSAALCPVGHDDAGEALSALLPVEPRCPGSAA